MSRIFIANIYFQIICGFSKVSMLKMSQLLKGSWAASRKTYHCLVCSAISVNADVHLFILPNICIHSGTFSRRAGVGFLQIEISLFSVHFFPMTEATGSSRQTQHRHINQTLFSYSQQTHTASIEHMRAKQLKQAPVDNKQ